MSHDFKIGDTVRLLNPRTYKPDTGRFAGVATVTKINAVNVKVNLNGVTVTASPSLLEHTDVKPNDVDTPSITVADVGKIVRVHSLGVARWEHDATTLFVIIGVHDRVKIVKLGGDGGRTWTFPKHLLTIVPLSAVTITA